MHLFSLRPFVSRHEITCSSLDLSFQIYIVSVVLTFLLSVYTLPRQSFPRFIIVDLTSSAYPAFAICDILDRLLRADLDQF